MKWERIVTGFRDRRSRLSLFFDCAPAALVGALNELHEALLRFAEDEIAVGGSFDHIGPPLVELVAAAEVGDAANRVVGFLAVDLFVVDEDVGEGVFAWSAVGHRCNLFRRGRAPLRVAANTVRRILNGGEGRRRVPAGYASGSSRDSIPSSSMGRERMSLGSWWLGRWSLAAGRTTTRLARTSTTTTYAPGSIARPCETASIIWPSISTAPLGSIFDRAMPTRPISARRGSSGATSSSVGRSPKKALPILVLGQYLNARATSVGTAKTATAKKMKPVAGPVVGPSQEAMMIDAMNETPARILMMPPEGMKTSSTTSAQPARKRRMAQAMSGMIMVGVEWGGRFRSAEARKRLVPGPAAIISRGASELP